MLYIYGALTVGGIETFFVRMAKERAKLGLVTYILLLSKKQQSNQELLNEMEKYATILFPEDIFSNIPWLSLKFPLLSPVKLEVVKNIINNVDQIHIYHGMHAQLGYHLCQLAGKNLPITIGFYHYIQYLWGGENTAWHEKINRKFIFNYLPEQSLLFFSEGTRDLYSEHKKLKFEKSNTFRLGVIDKKQVKFSGEQLKPLKIVAVGRLVEFKTYNFYMIDVISDLLKKGVDIQFDIYGDGPLKQQIQQKIKAAGLEDKIILKGTLDYSKFDETVTNYDLFIGSGTAVIQAAALGIASIVGVENTLKPQTYGYFCDVFQYEYNLKGLDIPLIAVDEMIKSYIALSDDSRLQLKEKHYRCVDAFTNENCQHAMDELKHIEMPLKAFKFNKFFYELSRLMDRVNMGFNKNHPRITQFEDFRKLKEN